jgi:hypothetical protein
MYCLYRSYGAGVLVPRTPLDLVTLTFCGTARFEPFFSVAQGFLAADLYCS